MDAGRPEGLTTDSAQASATVATVRTMSGEAEPQRPGWIRTATCGSEVAHFQARWTAYSHLSRS